MKQHHSRPRAETEAGRRARLMVALAFFAIVAITTVFAVKFARGKQAAAATPSNSPPRVSKSLTNSDLPSIEVAQAVMVTVELDFGSQIPSIAEALGFIERRYEPADGVGRTFAVLDAYGEPTRDHKLHISMHVSTEKPGTGSLVFRKTGEVLWKSRIIMGNRTEVLPLDKRALLILVDDGTGKSFTIDGSNNPATILQANLKELGVPLNSIWPDGTEREFTFLYSACGCPVKALVKRDGDRTVRSKDIPVMFPDDRAAFAVISRLMTWQ